MSTTPTHDATKPADSTITDALTPPKDSTIADAIPTGDDKPVEYKFTAPEGYDAKDLEAFAREAKLPPEVAQKVLERELKAQKAYEAQLAAQDKASRAKWMEQMRSHPEMGKDLGKTKETIDRVWSGLPDGLKKSLVENGYIEKGAGLDPILAELLFSVGRAMSEDTRTQVGTKPPRREGGLADIYAQLLEKPK